MYAKLIKGVLINLISQGWLIILTFLLTPYILRTLGTELYGLYILAQTLLYYATVLDLGFRHALVKYVAEYDGKDERERINCIVGWSLLAFLLFGLITGGTVFAGADFLASSVFSIAPERRLLAAHLFRIVAVLIIFNQLTEHVAAVAHGMQRFVIFNIKTLIFGTAMVGGVALILWLEGTLVEVFWLLVVSQVAILGITWVLIVSRLSIIPSFKADYFKSELSRMTGFGIFKFGGNIGGELTSQGGNVVIGSMLSAGQIPFFSIPARMTQRATVIVAQIMVTTFPFASYTEGKLGRGEVRRLTVRGQIVTAMISLVIFVGLLLLGEPFLAWWLDDPHFAAKAAMPLAVLALAYFLKSFSAIPGTVAEGLGKTKITAFFSLSNGILTVGLTALLIPYYSFTGAALAVLLAACITMPSFLFVFYTRVLQ